MTRARELSKLGNINALFVDSSNNVGVGSTSPDAKLDVVGIVSATYFYGDGSNITNAGSSLSAASGSQRVVVTSLTSGTMTSAGTDGDLTWNSSTNTLSATKFAGDGSNLSGIDATSIKDSGGNVKVQGNTSGIVVSGITSGLNVAGVLTAATGSFSGNVSVGGTLTYEDVTNIDSVGLITARSGIIVTSGISTFKGAHFDGGTLLKEKVNITAGKLSDNLNIDLENGMVHHFTTAETATSTPNIRVSSSVALNDRMAIGETITLSVITTAAAAGYSAQWTIDGSVTTEEWNGGSAPTAGGSSGKDFYTLNIIKTANATFTVLSNVSNFA